MTYHESGLIYCVDTKILLNDVTPGTDNNDNSMVVFEAANVLPMAYFKNHVLLLFRYTQIAILPKMRYPKT